MWENRNSERMVNRNTFIYKSFDTQKNKKHSAFNINGSTISIQLTGK